MTGNGRAGRRSRGLSPGRREHGASIIELAILFPVMALIVFGTFDLGRGYQLYLRAEAAAREGAAFAQIHPNDVDCAGDPDIVERVAAEEPGLTERPGFRVTVLGQADDTSFAAITGCGSDVAEPGERVRVEVSLTFDVLTPLVSRVVGGTIEITGDAEARVQG